MSTSEQENKLKIKQLIALLSFVLTLNDEEIRLIAIENAIDMLKDLDAD